MGRNLSQSSSLHNKNGMRNKRKKLLINHDNDNSLTPRHLTDAKQRAIQSSTKNNNNNNAKHKNMTIRILTGGGKIGFLIMSTTLGCMILLIFIQGSFLWAEQQQTTSVTSSSTAQQETSSSLSSNSFSSLLRGGGENGIGTTQQQQSWEEQRMHMLQQFRSPNSQSTTSTTTICQQLLQDKTATTTPKLWMKFIVPILKASQHPSDPNFVYEEWTKVLLSELNPTILEQLVVLLVQQIDGDGAVVQKKNENDQEEENRFGSSSMELSISNQKSIHRILKVIQTRLAAVVASPEQQKQHVESSSSPSSSLPPKLRIAVVGGRTTEGLDGCHLSSMPLPDKSSMVNPSLCSWPYRLEAFLNSLLGFEWVKVTNMAIEGTTTEFMIPFVKHQLYPSTNNDNDEQQKQQHQPPDIIIHAYRPSDFYNYHYERFVKLMGSPTSSSAHIMEKGQSHHWPPALKQMMHSELMGFIYAIETANPPLCNYDKDEEAAASLPLVIHLSEEEEEVMDYGGGSSGIGSTMTTTSTSYPYPSSLLSIRYKRPVQKAIQVDDKQQQREGGIKENNSNQAPFTMAGHMTLAWVVAFNLMELVFKHCSFSSNGHFSSSTNVAATVTGAKDCGTSSSCPFAFFANPTSNIGTVTNVKELNDYLRSFTIYNAGGWQVMSDMRATGYWSHKLGLVATQPNSTIIFEMKNIQQEIRYFHLMTVKTGTTTGSHQQTNQQPQQPPGQQWSTETTIQSKARFKLQSNPNIKDKQGIETVFDIEGSNASPKHMTYPFGLDLGENKVTAGSDVMLSIELVEGSNFKILGLMLCS